MSDGLKFTGKYRKNPDGSQGEPEATVLGVPADDIDGDEIKRLAKQRGSTPASLRKELLDSGLYREAPVERSEPVKADSGPKAADKE